MNKLLELNIQMFAEAGKLTIKVGTDTQDFEKGIATIKKSLSVKDLVKADLIGSAIKGIGSKLLEVNNKILGIGKSIAGLALTGGMDRAMNIEQATFKLKGLGHDTETVDKIMENALASVKGTAYGLGDAATVAASAVAAGVKPGQDLERTLKLVGDAAAISGTSMNDMGAIFNKVAAGGKMTGEELNQLTNAGIPMLQLLGESMGKTSEEVRDMVSAGEIGFDQFRNAIEKGMGGAALTMGQTFSGAVENTKAALSRVGEKLATPLMEGMTPVLGAVMDILDIITSDSMEGLDEALTSLNSFVFDWISTAIETLVPLLEKVIPVVLGVLSTLAEVIMEQMPMITNAVTQIVNGVMNLIVKFLPQLLTVVTTILLKLIEVIIQQLPNIIKALINGFVAIVDALAKEAPVLIPMLVDATLEAILTILDHIDEIIDAGITLIEALVDAFIDNIDKIIDATVKIIIAIITKLTDADTLGKLANAAWRIITKLALALIQHIPDIIKAGMQIVDAIKKEIEKAPGKMVKIGKDIIKGIWEGIKARAGKLADDLGKWADSMVQKIKDKLKIKSPSRVFRDEVGKMMAAGIGVGFEDEIKDVYKDMQNTVDLETSKMTANVQTSGTYQMAMTDVPTFNLLDNTTNQTQLVVNGRVLAEVVNTENKNREVAKA